ncbi:MAG: hypothetical protein AAGB97_08390 [Dehalococcoidia bacterium]|nr:hypothetical protein [Chloroflexota bacterium]MBT9162291.1 hypothetical protein [Chloroflexota bacterium]
MRKLGKIIGGLLALPSHIGRFFQKRYFYDAYKPTRIEAQFTGHFPAEHHIQAIPWISHERGYCQSTTLQMIARHHNIEKPRDYFAFLIGYTFGGIYGLSRDGFFFPFSDPEPGFVVAAPVLGLERKYLITNDEELLLNTIRYYLAQDIPVRIAWDAAIPPREGIERGYPIPVEEGWLDHRADFLPHSVLFVGYDEVGFYYFETGVEDKLVGGEIGTKVADQTVLEAIRSLSSTFGLPWMYMLIIFVEGERVEGLSPIWRRNGKALVGFKFGPMAWGSFGIRRFAKSIERKGVDLTPEKIEELKVVLEPFSYTRLDNALFLKRHFAGDPEIEKAASLLTTAGGYYEEILEIVTEEGIISENVERMVSLLRKGASLEREAGKVFVTMSER